MANKVLSIKKSQPVDVVLPDGMYTGLQSSNQISLMHKRENYELIVEEGIRGVNQKVVVIIDKGKATYHHINN